MKHSILIFGALAFGAVLWILGCIALIGFSYLFLLSMNYLAGFFAIPGLMTHEIDLIKVILTSIFFLLANIACTNYQKDIKSAEKSLREEINSLHNTLEQILLKYSEQESISEKLDSINENIEGIPDIQHIMNVIYKYKLPDKEERELLDQIKYDNHRFKTKE